MVYLFGVLGFLSGFVLGVMIIHFFLREKSSVELIGNKSLRWTYGLGVWACAALGAWAAVTLYGQYFS